MLANTGLQQLYCNIMTEIKFRQKVISDLLTGTIALGRRPAYELIHLEMRMICELIAISCLAAHGDIKATQSGRMASAHEADWILRALSKVHPDFFPMPMRLVKSGDTISINDADGPSFSREEIIKIYHRCGDLLHRGCLKNIGPHETKDDDFRAISDWPEKIGNLLDQHTIALTKPGMLVLVTIGDGNRADMKLLVREDEARS